MKLYEILKGSEYSLDMFSQEVIAELENRLYHVLCVIKK